MRANSSALSTMPSGESPNRFMIRSLSDPWLVPMRMRPAQFFAQLHQRRKLLLNPAQFRLILVVGIFLDREFLGIGVIAGVDADHLHPPGGFQRGLGFEMNIGHNRHEAAPRAQLLRR